MEMELLGVLPGQPLCRILRVKRVVLGNLVLNRLLKPWDQSKVKLETLA